MRCETVGAVFVALVLVLQGADGDRDLPDYRDVAPELGMTEVNLFGGPNKDLITESTGSGAACFDFDGDGRQDLYVVRGRSSRQAEAGLSGPPNQLFRNLGQGRFEEVARQAGVADTGWGGGAAAADYDNDGDVDLLVTNNGANVFYRNNGDGTFVDATAAAGLEDTRWSTSAAFGDVNGDGFLDLYVANYVAFDHRLLEETQAKFCHWRGLEVFCGPVGLPGEADTLYLNRGDGSFDPVTRQAGVYNPEGKGLGVTFFDFDSDGDQDIFVANDSTADFLYQNDGNGRFHDVALEVGVALSMDGRPQAGMGVDAGDFDEDALPDLVVTNFQRDYNALRRNRGGGLFVDVSDTSGMTSVSFARLGWGVRFLDANLDGFLDVFVVNGHVYPQVDAAQIGEHYRQANQLLLNVSGPRGRKFEDVSDHAGAGLEIVKSSRGLAVGDYDDDGDLDLFVNDIDAAPTFLEDRAAHANGWIRITIVGREGPRDGSGARVSYLTRGERHFRETTTVWSYLSTNDRRLLLGLGAASGAEEVSVHWPSPSRGERATLSLGAVARGEQILVLEGVGRIR